MQNTTHSRLYCLQSVWGNSKKLDNWITMGRGTEGQENETFYENGMGGKPDILSLVQ